MLNKAIWLCICSDDADTGITAQTSSATDTSIQWNAASAGDVPPSQPLFTGNPGVQVDISDSAQPIEYFQLFFDDDLFRHIVMQTNLYAEQYLTMNAAILKPFSRVRCWSPADMKEVKQFVGLCLLIGIVKKPSVASYWSRDIVLQTPIFRSVMKRNRFQLLQKFFHLNDNSTAGSSNDRLFKIRPVIDHLFEKFQATYCVHQNVAIDESLLLWKGRLLFK